MYYQQHLFFCTHMRTEGACCGAQGAADARSYTKDALKRQDAHGPGKIRVSSAGCLGRCQKGPCVLVYPQGLWYTYHSQQDLDAIIANCLGKGSDIGHLSVEDLAD